MLRGDSRGYILKHDDTIYTNPLIDDSTTPDLWTTEAILYDYRSIHTSCGTTATRKWAPWLTIDLDNESNISVQITSDNDRGKYVSDLALMNFDDNVEWGDPLIEWGDSTIVWGQSGIIEQKKRFPAGSLRFNYKQVRISNGYSVIQRSDDFATATVNGTANTASVSYAGGTIWDNSVVGYNISFADDTYDTEFPVVSASANSMTFLDI
jgi:hypothetical protein